VLSRHVRERCYLGSSSDDLFAVSYSDADLIRKIYFLVLWHASFVDSFLMTSRR
jgi:hypothetical protein